MPPTNQSVIIDLLNSLRCDVKDVATSLTGFKIEYEQRHSKLVTQTDLNTEKIVDVEKDNKELKAIVDKLGEEVTSLKLSVGKMYSIMRWALSIFTVLLTTLMLSALSFIWAILNHQIAIINLVSTPHP